MEYKYCAQRVHIFKDLSEDELKKITEMTKDSFFKKGDIIFNEDDIIDYLYIIHSGKIKAYKINEDGKEQILYLLSDGDTFGEYSIFREQKATFYAEAITDVRVCLLSRKNFHIIISKYPEIALKIMNYLSERLQNMELLLKDLSTEDVETRLKSMIIRLAQKEGSKTNKGIVINLYISREDIANLLGTTRETVSRKLHNLEDEGFIEFLSNKKILVKKY